MIEPPPLQLEDIWKKETIKQHSALLERDCAQFFHSHGDPVAAGVAVWVPCAFCGEDDFKTLFRQHAYQWDRCQACGLLQKRPRPKQSAMSRFYSEGQAVPFFEEKVLRAEREVRSRKIYGPNVDRLTALLENMTWRAGGCWISGAPTACSWLPLRRGSYFPCYAGIEPNAASAAEATKIRLSDLSGNV